MKYEIIKTKIHGDYYKCKYCKYKTKYLYKIKIHKCRTIKMIQNKVKPIRIRYKKTKNEGILESERTFTSVFKKNSIYKVYLNENEGSYRIQNMNTKDSIYSGSFTKSLKELRKKAKIHLEKLGIKFKTGIRKKRKEN